MAQFLVSAVHEAGLRNVQERKSIVLHGAFDSCGEQGGTCKDQAGRVRGTAI